MRLFISINFDRHMKDALISVQEQLKEHHIRGNYSKSENLHLTLAFIGEYSDPDIVLEALSNVKFAPFELRLKGIGSFDDLWWAGLSAFDDLKACASKVRHSLSSADIPFDRKKFSPHITLIREPSKPEIPQIIIPDVSFTVKEFSLMRSDRGRRGVIYTELGSIHAQ